MRGQHYRVVQSSNHHCCRLFESDANHHSFRLSREVNATSSKIAGFAAVFGTSSQRRDAQSTRVSEFSGESL